MAILKNDYFDELMIYAMAEFSSRNPNESQQVGANEFERVLRSLCETSEDYGPFPVAGLEHNLEVRRPELGEEKETSTKK